MFDHVAFGVGNVAASKAFLLDALEPIGMAVLAEATASVEPSADGQASLCMFQTDEKPAHLHLAFAAGNREGVEAFHRGPWRRVARTTPARACDRTMPGNILPPSSHDRTDTTPKWFATYPKIDGPCQRVSCTPRWIRRGNGHLSHDQIAAG